MLSVITLTSKKSTIIHYTTALNASKQENDTEYQFEIFYACAVVVTLRFAKTTLLAWHYFWREEIGSDTFFGFHPQAQPYILVLITGTAALEAQKLSVNHL